MEKIDKTCVTHRIHKIYCDQCGKHLQDSFECDDGWYPNNYVYTRRFCMGHDRYSDETFWYETEMTLCDDCGKSMDVEIDNMLIGLGFNKR